MRGFFLLFRRDLQQRWMLFAASFAMGLFILGLPLLKGSHLSPTELRGAAGLTAVLIWCAMLAIFLGGSIFTRDLTEGRLAFDFRLPVRPGAIWAARLLAAVATMALAASLLLAPPAIGGMDLSGAAAGFDVLLHIGDGGQGLPSRLGLTFAPLALLALLLLANPAALASRTRQAWSAADLLSFGLVIFAGYWSWQTLRPWDANHAIWWTTAVLIATTLIGTAVASLLQVVHGRTETDRAQSRLSIGLLATALLASAVGTGYSQWLVHPTLNDLVGNVATAQSLGPDWVVIQGPTRSDHQLVARFLVSPATGQSRLLGPLPQSMWSRKSAVTSIDGSTIAWLQTSNPGSSSYLLEYMSTAVPQVASQISPVTLSAHTVSWTLSSDGSTVAALELVGGPEDPMRLVVSRIDSGDVLAAIQFPSCNIFGDMLFISEEEVAIPCGFPSYTDVRSERTFLVRVDLAQKSVREEDYYPELPPQLDRSLGLIQTARGWLELSEVSDQQEISGWVVQETSTDTRLVELKLPERVQNPYARGRQLRDGTFAIAMTDRAESRLLLFSERGQFKKSILLSPGTSRILAESSNSGALVLATAMFIPGGPTRQSYSLVDTQTGSSSLLGEHLFTEDYLGGFRPTQSVFRSKARLFWFNPATKALQPLLDESQYFEEGLPTGSSS